MAKHVFELFSGSLFHRGEFVRLTEKRVVVKAPHNMRGEGFANREGTLIVETDDPVLTRDEFERRANEFRDRIRSAEEWVLRLKNEQRAHAMASLKIVVIEENVDG